MYGKKSKLGKNPSWTLDEMQKVLSQNSNIKKPFINMPPAQILNSMTMHTIDQFVDGEKAECKFDSPEFIKLLKLVHSYYKGDSEEYKEPKDELLNDRGLISMLFMGGIKNLSQIDNDLNQDVNIIGFPTSQGSGNIADFQFSFGMFKDSEYKDGVWQFIKSFFKQDYQDKFVGYEIPVLKASYDKMLDKSEATKEQKEQFDKIVNGITKSSSYDGTLMGIIIEEPKSVFEGKCSEEEAAKKIQSRANIYISERK